MMAGEVNFLCMRMTVLNGLPQMTRGDDLIAFDQPPPSSPSSKSTFISIWESEDSVCDMRGWSDSKAPELVKKLQASQDMRLEILPDHEQPFRGKGDLYTTGNLNEHC